MDANKIENLREATHKAKYANLQITRQIFHPVFKGVHWASKPWEETSVSRGDFPQTGKAIEALPPSWNCSVSAIERDW